DAAVASPERASHPVMRAGFASAVPRLAPRARTATRLRVGLTRALAEMPRSARARAHRGPRARHASCFFRLRGSFVKTWPGQPLPLGATFDGLGTCFSVASDVACAIELCLCGADGAEERVLLRERSGAYWHAYLPGVEPGQRYGY